MDGIRYVILLCVVVIFGCRDEYVAIQEIEHPYDFILEGDLKANDIVSIKLFESLPIGHELRDFDRRDAEVFFWGDDILGVGHPMAYNDSSEKYLIVHTNFKVKQGNTYGVTIILPNENQDTIRAHTKIPRATAIVQTTFTDVRQISINDTLSQWELDVAIKISEPQERPVYYRLMPSRFISAWKLNPLGLPDYEHYVEQDPLVAIDYQDDQSAYQTFSHKDGIYIDESRLTSNLLRLTLKTVTPVRDGKSITVEEGIEIIKKFRFELETLNEERYQWEERLHEITQNQGPVNVRNVDNITNAAGVFGGSSRSIGFPELD